MYPVTVNKYEQGTAVILTTGEPFTSYLGTVVDPDLVYLGVQINGNDGSTTLLTFKYTNGVGDTTGTIVRTGVGAYQASIDSSLYPAGVWVYSWMGEPSEEVNIDSTKTKVRSNDKQLIIEQPAFPLG